MSAPTHDCALPRGRAASRCGRREHVATRLRAAHPGLTVELVPMTTQGDRILDRSLAQIGGKGLFIKELETGDVPRGAPTSPCTR